MAESKLRLKDMLILLKLTRMPSTLLVKAPGIMKHLKMGFCREVTDGANAEKRNNKLNIEKGGPDGTKKTCKLVGISPHGISENNKREARCSVLETSGQSLISGVIHRLATVQAKMKKKK